MQRKPLMTISVTRSRIFAKEATAFSIGRVDAWVDKDMVHYG